MLWLVVYVANCRIRDRLLIPQPGLVSQWRLDTQAHRDPHGVWPVRDALSCVVQSEGLGGHRFAFIQGQLCSQCQGLLCGLLELGGDPRVALHRMVSGV